MARPMIERGLGRTHQGQQLLCLKRLFNEFDRARLDRPDRSLDVALAADHDDREARRIDIPPFEHLESAEARHAQVEQQDSSGKPLDFGKETVGRSKRSAIIAGGFKKGDERISESVVIVDDDAVFHGDASHSNHSTLNQRIITNGSLSCNRKIVSALPWVS